MKDVWERRILWKLHAKALITCEVEPSRVDATNNQVVFAFFLAIALFIAPVTLPFAAFRITCFFIYITILSAKNFDILFVYKHNSSRHICLQKFWRDRILC